ncbi:MAG: propanediol dehydratase, partial [Propionibacteriales bacterium]
MDQEALKKIIESVIAEMAQASSDAGQTSSASTGAAKPESGGTATVPAVAVGKVGLAEAGVAERGTDPKEVVIGLSPAFSDIL